MKPVGVYQKDMKALMDKAKEIEAQASVDNRELTGPEAEKHGELLAEVERIRGIVDTLLRRERLEAEMNTPEPAPTARAPQMRQPEPRSEEKFRSLGEQLIAVARAETRQGTDPRLFRAAATGMSESVPADGGFLVQTDFSNELLEQTFATGLLPARCRRIQISSNANSVKLNGVDETSRASTRFGGVLAYWIDEAAEKSASKPKFRQITLDLKKLIGLCYATDELLADASALSSYIQRAFPAEFGFRLDDAIVNGTGAGQPLGVLNSGCLVTVSKEAGQLADTILAENIWKMYARMFPASVSNAVWLINQACWPQLYSMSLSVGTGGGPLFVPAGGISASPFNTLLGRPVIPIEQCAALGDLGDIIFADFGGYLLAEKGGIESAMSIHVKFIYDESVFRFVLRVDGQPERASALTPYKGGAGATLSHFVTLEAR